MVPKTQQYKPQSWMGGQKLRCPRAASWDSKPNEAFRGPPDGDCSHEIKRHLLLGKVMTNVDSILKSRDITFQQSLSSQGYGVSSGHVWM